ncbi:MAG: polysaccharide export protein [Hyphomonas sp.]|nr:polysaccharide export protein [Hyphomonas sp.]
MTRELKGIIQLIFCALCLGFATACQSTVTTQAPSGAPTDSANQAYDGEYRLGPADQLRVTVFGHDDLSNQYTVASNGTISFPLIGDVEAAGLTVTEFQRITEQRLSEGFLKSPRVTAEIMTFRPFYILGEVSRAGEYPYTNRLTVLNAIATAGGFSHRANRKVIAIKSFSDTEERRVELTPSTYVQPGDTIRVLERFF